MLWQPFEGPRRKVGRARRHVEELRGLLDPYLADIRIHAIHENGGDPVRRQDIWRIQFNAAPDGLAEIVGDAVHNLRAALDVMIGDLVVLHGVKVKRARYPFAENEAKVGETFDRDLENLGPEARAAIVATRPHKGGNVPLRWLHELDITDKHDALTPVFLAAIGQPQIPPSISTFPLSLPSGHIAEGSLLVVKRGADPLEGISFSGAGSARFSEKSEQFPEAPVLEALEGLADLVDGLITTFASKFGSRYRRPEPFPVAAALAAEPAIFQEMAYRIINNTGPTLHRWTRNRLGLHYTGSRVLRGGLSVAHVFGAPDGTAPTFAPFVG